MLKITVIAIGKIKNKNFKNSFDDYLKMICPYANVKIIEVESEPFFDNSDKEKIKQKEGEKIYKHLSKFSSGRVFILDEKGQDFDSKSFSDRLFCDEREDIIFVIGGSLGLSEEILGYKNSFKVSLSKLTFPHELARVLLMEQLFRAIAINRNKSYHY